MKILLVEDDFKISEFIQTGLTQEGYSVDVCTDGKMGLDYAQNKSFDLIILDIMLPKRDGLSVLKELKKEGDTTPILILSAKQSVEDRVKGLNAGADDYLIKPFSFSELTARVNALLRRKNELTNDPSLTFAELTLDRYTRKVSFMNQSLELRTKEFSLLELFMRNKERVLSKNLILDRIWNIDFDPQTNVVDVLVCRLRNKIEKTTGRKYIHTIRGIGYVLKKD